MNIINAKKEDKFVVLALLDEFMQDYEMQVFGKKNKQTNLRIDNEKMYESLIGNDGYCVLLIIDKKENAVGIITGYLCPMLRTGEMRAEVEEFYVKDEYRGTLVAKKLMDAFFRWCKIKDVKEVNLESNDNLRRAHSFYRKYGFEIKAKRFVKKLSK